MSKLLITAKYLRPRSILLTKKTSSASSAWKGTLEARTSLTGGIWIVGNGTDIYFWHPVPLLNFLTDQQRSQIDLIE